MAFDGVVISSVVSQLKSALLGGRIYKIYQPENDELILVIKNQKETHRLLLSAGASLPLIYLTEETKGNPMNAPNFCMLLRKHLNNGRIISIEQPNFERIVNIGIEHLNELGDLCTKHLIIEIMGKHSNIIFVDDTDHIIDSIKHISAQVSSVREVLPGREYFIPPTQEKISPFSLTPTYFEENICKKPLPLTKAIYTSLTGISPLIAEEICYRAGLDSNSSTSSLTSDDKLALFSALTTVMELIKQENFSPNIVFRKEEPVEFSSIPLTMYGDYETVSYDSISEVLESYYAFKSKITRIRQKSADLRKIVSNAIERASKKYDLQLRQLKDTEKRDKYRIYGELINTYGYGLEFGAKSLTCLNYYTNEEITIPLEETLSPQENSKKYFAKYNKLKRTYEALTDLIVETVRTALKRTITRKYCEGGQMKVITLDAELEKMMVQSISKSEQGVYLALSPEVMQSMLNQMTEQFKKFHELSGGPIILTSQVIRIHFYRLIEQFFPNVRVLSFNEIANNIQIQAIGTITL